MRDQRSAILDELAIPEPAHPEERRQPLPWRHPKPPQEDPDALRRIEAILQSPSYRLAEQDADLLGRDEARGLRLQLEYLKPELLLEAHGIDHTIVVFGSFGHSSSNILRLTSSFSVAASMAKSTPPNSERLPADLIRFIAASRASRVMIPRWT